MEKGHYDKDKKAYVYPLRVPTKPYYKRHQARTLYTGEKVSILDTRFTCGTGFDPSKPGPRGGKGLTPFYRCVYYQDGIFYRSVNTPTAIPGKYMDLLFPVDGTIYTKSYWCDSCYEKGIPTAEIRCSAGYPIWCRVTFADGDSIEWDNSQDWTFLEYELDLVAKKRKSPCKKH